MSKRERDAIHLSPPLLSIVRCPHQNLASVNQPSQRSVCLCHCSRVSHCVVPRLCLTPSLNQSDYGYTYRVYVEGPLKWSPMIGCQLNGHLQAVDGAVLSWATFGEVVNWTYTVVAHAAITRTQSRDTIYGKRKWG